MDRAVSSNDNGGGHGSGDGDGDGGGDGDQNLCKSTLCHISISSPLRSSHIDFEFFASTLAVQHNRRRHVVTDEMTRASLGLVRSYSSKLRQVCGPNAIVAPS